MVAMNKVPSRWVHIVVLLFAWPAFGSPDQAIVEPIEVTTSYAKSGDPVAQFNLGVRYAKGEGVAKNEATAITWFKQSAEAGFPQAAFNLSVLYENGNGVPRDEKEVIKWLTVAANHGLFDAQKLLIEIYSQGRGTPKNPALALTWDFIARRTLELLHEGAAGEPPKPALLRKDGAAELVTKDGSKKVILPDGGEETTLPDGSRVITYKNGRSKTITPDKTAITKYPSGHVETEFPDGRAIMRGPDGSVETTYPDGRKVREYNAEDTRGRKARVTETKDAKGKRMARVIVRDNVTIHEDADGPTSVETILTDAENRKVKLTEEIQKNGKVGQRKLARVDSGKEPKGTEVWTIQREIETASGVVLVEETYSSLGIGNQRVLKQIGPTAENRGNVAVQNIPVASDRTAPTQYVVPAREMSVEMQRSSGIRVYGADAPSIFKTPVDISPMLKELEALELKSLHFAGATDADWMRAKAAAANYIVPLGRPPQHSRPTNWFSIQQLSRGTLPVPPFTPALDDGSKQFPLGLHGRDVIAQPGWKHAQTPHFVVHYVEDSDARLSMQYIEGAYTIITALLGLDPERGKQKGHVFLFADENAWKAYLLRSNNSPLLAGFAYKNELLLPAVVEKAGAEDSVKTLCHEVTHAIVARFYPAAKPPLWLNEGFAEYIAARTIALKRGHSVDKYISTKLERPMKLVQVLQRIRYGVPQGSSSVGGPVRFIGQGEEYPVLTFYANAAWCARALAEKLPPEGLPKFFNAISAGNSPNASLRFAYGEKCPSTAAFAKIVDSMEIPKKDAK